MDPSLISFFKPCGIVVMGASTSPEKLGYGVARNLIQSGYPGAIHFVSQKQVELFGQPMYTDMSKVPEPVDLAILIVPPNATPKTIEECGRRGIHAAIIMSSGFREVGQEGAALEKQCIDVARAHGVRLLGPNCIGTIDTHLPLDTTFLQPPMPAQGGIGFISQSGAFCAAIIDWSRREGFGFSQLVSLGNQADVNETDALAALAEDEHTRVIVLYMESVSDGRRFIEVARQVTKHKPVIALKVGRFESGQKAAASHTGALAASDTAFEAAFEKAGIMRAETAEQIFDWARALEIYPSGLDLQRPFDNSHNTSTAFAISHAAAQRVRCQREQGYSSSGKYGIGVLTNAGGPGVIAADSLEDHGLQLAQLTESTLETLSAALPAAANVHNPVDMLASATPATYASCLNILLSDKNVNGMLIILPPPPMFRAEDVAKELVHFINDHATSPGITRPVVVALMGSTLIEDARATFESSKIPCYPFPERAASALGALVKRTQCLTTVLYEDDKKQGHIDSEISSRLSVSVEDFDVLLSTYGIAFTPAKLARELHEAESIANEIGYPVVMKIASPDILHKSDVGGVSLDIEDAKALKIAYTQMLERVGAAEPEAQLNGVHIQRQISSGQEVIVGGVRDPQFGPLMMFGSGGVEVEGLKDVAFALAPLNQAEASKMIRKTWAGRKLAGFRGILPADEEAVLDVLIKLSYLVWENPSIQEIAINPLRVLSIGAVAVDVRVKFAPEIQKRHLM